MRDFFADLIHAVEVLGGNVNVTWKSLVLGDADAARGWYGKSYTESTTQVVIQPTKREVYRTGVGMYGRVDAAGYTKAAVQEGDLIVDSNDQTWKILTVAPHMIGDKFIFNLCALAWASPEAVPTAPTESPPGESAYWILVIEGDAGCTTSPSGVQFILAGLSIDVAVTVNKEYNWYEWVLDGAVFSTEQSITVPPQSLKVVHVLSALTRRIGTKEIGPVEGAGLIESALRGSAGMFEDSFGQTDLIVQGVGKAGDDSFSRVETLSVTNS